MAYPVITVANSLLKVARDNHELLTPLKLQKLVYLAQGVALAVSDGQKPLFDEPVRAWQYGPVVQSLYDAVKRYGSGSITESIPMPTAYFFSPPVIPESDEFSWDVLRVVWEAYGHLSATQLVALTHREGLPEGYPWHEAWVERGGQSAHNTLIDKAIMISSFNQIVAPKQLE